MNNTRYHTCRNAMSKWLLAVVLFLSLFTPPGLPSRSNADQRRQQTSLLFSRPSRFIGHIVFNGAIRQISIKPAAGLFFVSSFLNLVSLHTMQASVCLKSRRINLNCINKSFFCRVKTTSSTCDDPSPSLV
jgi:hypothetical protein